MPLWLARGQFYLYGIPVLLEKGVLIQLVGAS